MTPTYTGGGTCKTDSGVFWSGIGSIPCDCCLRPEFPNQTGRRQMNTWFCGTGRWRKGGGIFGCMGLLVFAMAADVRAGASDGQWTYSRMITVINGSTQALAQYQVGITVPYEEGMRGDFGDLRFQDAEGNELSYWTASQTDGVEAHVWVKAPELAAEGMAVWRMLFGNDAAESASDFDATMTKGSVQDGLVGCWHMDEGQG
ncbi:MAG: DUF2341 domain-containing protein, partial [Opitutae bacterium]|nr:DUF2341 domain-containing protein [Opitutae bacterium]